MTKLAKKIDILHKTGKTVFSVPELAMLWGISNKNVLRVNLSRAKSASYIESIRRGLYKLVDIEINHFELACMIKKNSYISFETALAKEGIIQQWEGSYFAASDRKFQLQNKYGQFIYRRLPENVLNNRVGIEHIGNYFIATKERAICDYVYKAGLQFLDDLTEVDKDKLLEISKIYNCKKLEKNIKKLIK